MRPPVGIPMTRLALSEEGGLVLPGGQMGTLVANEDAFAREILGLPTAAPQQQPEAAQQQQQAAVPAAGGEAKPPLLLLDSKPAAESASAAAAALAVKAEPGAAGAAAAVPAPAAGGAALGPVAAPMLAGEAELAASAPFGAMPGAGFFSMFMQTALLPRGPPDFLRCAFDRPEPLPRAGGWRQPLPAPPVGARLGCPAAKLAGRGAGGLSSAARSFVLPPCLFLLLTSRRRLSLQSLSGCKISTAHASTCRRCACQSCRPRGAAPRPGCAARRAAGCLAASGQ